MHTSIMSKNIFGEVLKTVQGCVLMLVNDHFHFTTFSHANNDLNVEETNTGGIFVQANEGFPENMTNSRSL